MTLTLDEAIAAAREAAELGGYGIDFDPCAQPILDALVAGDSAALGLAIDVYEGVLRVRALLESPALLVPTADGGKPGRSRRARGGR